jgi:hypothetical protein
MAQTTEILVHYQLFFMHRMNYWPIADQRKQVSWAPRWLHISIGCPETTLPEIPSCYRSCLQEMNDHVYVTNFLRLILKDSEDGSHTLRLAWFRLWVSPNRTQYFGCLTCFRPQALSVCEGTWVITAKKTKITNAVE